MHIGGKYELLEAVGSGGMATVHRAKQRDVGFDRILAIKTIKPDLAKRPDYVSRFIREARVLSLLAHPNILQMYELGRTPAAGPFIAMEYLEGYSLQRILGAASSLQLTIPLHVALSLLHDLCDALDHVHTRRAPDGSPLSIVHRDISHGNLFVTRSGHLKLIDFGIAAVGGETPDRPGEIAGKPSYMAPETIRGRAADASADVFSLGVVAWEILTARRLYTADTDHAIMQAVVHDPAPAPSVYRDDCPPLLDELIQATLIKDPRRRTTTAAQLRSCIETVMRAHNVDARPSAVARWMIDSGFETILNTTELDTDPSMPIDVAPDTTIQIPAQPQPTGTSPTPLAWQAAPVFPVLPRSRFAVRIGTAASLLAAGALAAFVTTARPQPPREQQAAVEPRPSQNITVEELPPPPPPPPPVQVAAVEVAPPIPVAAPVTRARHAHARRTELVIGTGAAVPPLAKPSGEVAIAAAPVPVATAPTALPMPVAQPAPQLRAMQPQPTGPRTIPPTRVRLLAGEIGHIDPRLLDQAGDAVRKPASALLCINDRGAVTSVKLLTERPSWLRDRLVHDLQTFRFTAYVEGTTAVPACFVRPIVLASGR